MDYVDSLYWNSLLEKVGKGRRDRRDVRRGEEGEESPTASEKEGREAELPIVHTLSTVRVDLQDLRRHDHFGDVMSAL